MKHELIFSVLVENQSSILTRILGLFNGRGFDMYSITIGPAEKNEMSRITLVVPGQIKLINQLIKQLYKLLPVIKIENLTYIPSIHRELLLCKIFAIGLERSKLLEISTFFDAKVVDFTPNVLTIEMTGNPEKIIALEQVINKFGIIEVVRTGRIALSRESLINTTLVIPKKSKPSKLTKLNFKKLEKNSNFVERLKVLKREEKKKSYLN